MSTQRGFAAGTLVHCEDGLRPIETVATGDRVLAAAGDDRPPQLRTVRDVCTRRAEVMLLPFAKRTASEALGTLVVARRQDFRVVARDAGGGMTQPVGEWQPASGFGWHTLLQGRRDPRLRAGVPMTLRMLPAGGLWVETGPDGEGGVLATAPPGAAWPPPAAQAQSRDAIDPAPGPGFLAEPGEEHLLWWETPARLPVHGLVIDGVHGYFVHAVGVLARD